MTKESAKQHLVLPVWVGREAIVFMNSGLVSLPDPILRALGAGHETNGELLSPLFHTLLLPLHFLYLHTHPLCGTGLSGYHQFV